MSDKITRRLEGNLAEAILNFREVREEVHDAYKTATGDEERGILLNFYKLVMDGVEKTITPSDLESFRMARRQDYNLLLVSECVDGKGDVSPDALRFVAVREVRAGRISPDDELYRLAMTGPQGITPELPAKTGWRRFLPFGK